jgi:hypothetical protein
MSYQILFTDLDGTLLNSRGEITEANRQAITKAIAHGKKVVLCSGRSWRSLQYYEQDLGLDKPGCYGVSFNGGVIYVYTDKTGERDFLLKQYMDNALGREIARALKKTGVEIAVYTEDDLVAEEVTSQIRFYSNFTRIPVRIVNDFDEVTEPFVKILAKGENAVLRETEREMSIRFKDSSCNIFFSSPELLEFGPSDGDKGKGIIFLAEYLNIPLSEVIAMGDEANDITMLQAAGLGIAVANAVPGAKAAADLTLLYNHNQDAVSHVIHTYLMT